MSVEDYRINAFVRTVFVRRWIDTSRVDFGTSNGVVYVRGILRQVYGRKQLEDEKDEDETSLLSLVRRIEKEIRSIPGVRDVVFRLDNFEKTGGKWKRRIKTFP
jgi:Mg2+/Co2+ transporter CorC